MFKQKRSWMKVFSAIFCPEILPKSVHVITSIVLKLAPYVHIFLRNKNLHANG